MADQLIDDYLHELRVSAWVRQLPDEQTATLERQTREKIAAELSRAGKRDEATVYEVLDRLGPAGDIVSHDTDAPPSGAQRAIHTLLTPVARLQFKLAARGWGLPEFGGLFLLILGPYLLWWVGPIFGIILIRYAANRWTDRAEHVSTVIVFSLLGVQVLLNLGLLVYVLLTGGPLMTELQRVLSSFTPGVLGSMSPVFNPSNGPVFWVQLIGALLAPVAGLVSGVYLVLSPRARR